MIYIILQHFLFYKLIYSPMKKKRNVIIQTNISYKIIIQIYEAFAFFMGDQSSVIMESTLYHQLFI